MTDMVKFTTADTCYAKRQLSLWKNGSEQGTAIINSAPAPIHLIWVRNGHRNAQKQLNSVSTWWFDVDRWSFELITVPGDRVPAWLLSDEVSMERQLTEIDAWWFDVHQWTSGTPAAECWKRFLASRQE